jgi:hypothetical protein
LQFSVDLAVKIPDLHKIAESTTTRTAAGLDFTAIGGKRQGHGVPQSLRTTRWNRGFSCEAPGLKNPIKSNWLLQLTIFAAAAIETSGSCLPFFAL